MDNASTPLEPAPGPNYVDVPRGNTQKHVNRDVLRYVLERSGLSASARVLDVPCGAGEFLGLLRRYWPGSELTGGDLRPDAPAVPGVAYQPVDLSKPFDLRAGNAEFDLITCISGVMSFGNTQAFVANCARPLRPGGQFVVTNDNVGTVRDRFSYLFTGRVRRFKLLFETTESISQLVQLQELHRLLEAHGLQVREVFYTSLYPEDFLFLPLGLLLYPMQWLYLRRLKHPLPQTRRRQMFGFRSLLYRHYVLVGEKRAE
jgi:2-polyprenyl-3-methyl-5-hydroxy-6-metoxy-1,4-benzoquinol methylase